MKKQFTPNQLLKRFSPQLESSKPMERIMVGIFILMFLAGVPAFYLQYTEGHIVTGMRDNVIWGIYIVNFIFYLLTG